jgi:osmotically-inducible protein OsmY
MADSPEGQALVENLARKLEFMGALSPDQTSLILRNRNLKVKAATSSLWVQSYVLRSLSSSMGIESLSNAVTLYTPTREEDFVIRDFDRLLETDAATLPLPVHASFRGHTLTLEGRLASHAPVPVLMRMAQEVEGVERVENKIDISDDGNSASEPEIVNSVRERLRADPWTEDRLLFLSAHDGIVKLRGFVANLFQLQRVRDLSWTWGVRGVDSEGLQVRSDLGSRAYSNAKLDVNGDEALRSELELVYAQDPYLYRDLPRIIVRNGVAIVSGEVNSLKALRNAQLWARLVPGITKVRMLLRIRRDSERKDRELSFDLRSKLGRLAPLEDARDIGLVVRNGNVRLVGRVPSLFESWMIDDEISRVPGVQNIVNDLHVARASEIVDDASVRDNFLSSTSQLPIFDTNDRLDIYVENGRALLTGVVDCGLESLVAVRSAFESGAREVDNRIMTRTSPWSETYFDDAKATTILDSLMMDGLSEPYAQRAL